MSLRGALCRWLDSAVPLPGRVAGDDDGSLLEGEAPGDSTARNNWRVPIAVVFAQRAHCGLVNGLMPVAPSYGLGVTGGDRSPLRLVHPSHSGGAKVPHISNSLGMGFGAGVEGLGR